jgi:YHS domain-containing protein
MTNNTASQLMYIDPVCLMEVDTSKQNFNLKYQGCTYFFLH